MRKLFAILLVGAALSVLLPYLPQVIAYQTAQVDQNGTFSVSSSNGLVSCTVPKLLTIKKGTSTTDSTAFQCVNNFSHPITLYWSMKEDPSGYLAVSGSDTLNPTDPPNKQCRAATFTDTRNANHGPVNVVIKGATAPTADFQVEIYFPATIDVKNNSSGGC